MITKTFIIYDGVLQGTFLGSYILQENVQEILVEPFLQHRSYKSHNSYTRSDFIANFPHTEL